MVVVNSICGCAAGRMRSAVRMALQNAPRPDQAFSVFAGQDLKLPNAPGVISRDIRLVAVDCDPARRKLDLYDGTQGHRSAAKPPTLPPN